MTIGLPDITPAGQTGKRMPAFLLLSLLLHLVWLTLPIMPKRATRHQAPSARPLAVHLARPQPAMVAPVGAKAARAAVVRGLVPPAEIIGPPPPATDHGEPRPAASADQPPAIVDIGQALATARSAAREWQAAPGAMAPPALPATVETVVARAARSDVVVEIRGAAGEWITRRGNSRCITPLQVPFFLAGKSLLTQCDAWKS
jgi:hypothetical protein